MWELAGWGESLVRAGPLVGEPVKLNDVRAAITTASRLQPLHHSQPKSSGGTKSPSLRGEKLKLRDVK